VSWNRDFVYDGPVAAALTWPATDQSMCGACLVQTFARVV